MGTSSGGYLRERARTRCSGDGSLWDAGSCWRVTTVAGADGDTGASDTSVKVSSSEHHSRSATKLAGWKHEKDTLALGHPKVLSIICYVI